MCQPLLPCLLCCRPVLDPLPRYECSVHNGGVFIVPGALPSTRTHAVSNPADDRSMVIVGGGPAGLAAAQTLREDGFTGRVVLISKETELPYDRTKFSKNMAMQASEVWCAMAPCRYSCSCRRRRWMRVHAVHWWLLHALNILGFFPLSCLLVHVCECVHRCVCLWVNGRECGCFGYL